MFPIEKWVFFAEKLEVSKWYLRGQGFVEIFTQFAGQLDKSTENVIRTLEVSDSYTGHVLALILRQAPKSITIICKDKWYFQTTARLHKFGNDFVCATFLVNFLKVGSQDDHLNLANLQILHHFM